MRQPGRHLYSDLTGQTFNKFLDEVPSAKNFLFYREMIDYVRVPLWDHCLDYEYQIRKDAFKLVRLKGFAFQQALWAAYHDQAHGMEHWITLFIISNASRSSSSTESADKAKIAQLETEMAEMKKLMKSARSRSPHASAPQWQAPRQENAQKWSHEPLAFVADKRQGKEGQERQRQRLQSRKF